MGDVSLGSQPGWLGPPARYAPSAPPHKRNGPPRTHLRPAGMNLDQSGGPTGGPAGATGLVQLGDFPVTGVGPRGMREADVRLSPGGRCLPPPRASRGDSRERGPQVTGGRAAGHVTAVRTRGSREAQRARGARMTGMGSVSLKSGADPGPGGGPGGGLGGGPGLPGRRPPEPGKLPGVAVDCVVASRQNAPTQPMIKKVRLAAIANEKASNVANATVGTATVAARICPSCRVSGSVDRRRALRAHIHPVMNSPSRASRPMNPISISDSRYWSSVKK